MESGRLMGMRILTIQQRAREVGRIRLGEQREKTRDDGSVVNYPARLDTFRFTSPSREAVELAAGAYGGDIRAWGDQWEVISTSSAIPIAVPGGIDPVSQAYELWSGGGCLRRCDGETEWISGQPCMCENPGVDKDECKPTLRVALFLPEVDILGVWRLEVKGYYANTELPAMISMLQAVPGHVRGTLRLEAREVKREGKTIRFPVPVIDVTGSLAALVDGEMPARAALPKPTRPALPPGPDPEPLPARRGDQPQAPPPVEEAKSVGVQRLDELRAMPLALERSDPARFHAAALATVRQAVTAAGIPWKTTQLADDETWARVKAIVEQACLIKQEQAQQTLGGAA